MIGELAKGKVILLPCGVEKKPEVNKEMLVSAKEWFPRITHRKEEWAKIRMPIVLTEENRTLLAKSFLSEENRTHECEFLNTMVNAILSNNPGTFVKEYEALQRRTPLKYNSLKMRKVLPLRII